MNTSLENTQVESCELLFVVKDRAEIAKLLFEKYDKADFGVNYRLVTATDLCAFMHWAPGTVRQGNCLFWDDYKNQYQVTPSNLLESSKSRAAGCLNFCKDYLGAKAAIIVKNKSENSTEKLDVAGGISGGKDDIGNANIEANFSKQKEAALKLDSRFAFGPTSPIPFNPEEAFRHYTQMHFDRFEEFQYVYEFRKNSPVVLKDDLPYSVELSFFQRGKRLIDVAGKIGANLKGFGLNMHVDFQNDTEWDALENLEIKVVF